ncbi:MAG: aminotransferase class I/II-fold pyridoxal phosphate-dependent enzyme [Oscillospiraceae bacterium]|nr:aminotransferase class I/II-fold pyridoxal phosphate-dependent enzyme [Oscillospiraceae bacterium]
MKPYNQLSAEELKVLHAELLEKYNEYKSRGLNLDMSRGKPAPSQLDLCMELLDVIGADGEYTTKNGTDIRNYGVLDGITEAKELFAPLLGVKPENVFVGGSSSLTLMYDAVCRAYTHGAYGSERPWCKEEKLKFLCPAPGYDRHFRITEHFGFELVTIPMVEGGPDMDAVEEAVKDPAVKGIWCVPKYSNPLGTTYSDETVKRMAALKPAAKDFRIFWDNAYAIHDLYEDKQDVLLDIMQECEKNGTQDMVYIFASTSKVTFPGAGVAVMGMSDNNMALMKKHAGVQAIGYDKINQLRHVKYFGSYDGMLEHMKKLGKALQPKFETVKNTLDKELKGLEIGRWNDPMGGYFVAFDSMDGCAKRIVALCSEAGVKMTGAGATFPYGKDPHDSNIRIAPSYPPVDELKTAMELFCLCVKLASVEKLMA